MDVLHDASIPEAVPNVGSPEDPGFNRMRGLI